MTTPSAATPAGDDASWTLHQSDGHRSAASVGGQRVARCYLAGASIRQTGARNLTPGNPCSETGK